MARREAETFGYILRALHSDNAWLLAALEEGEQDRASVAEAFGASPDPAVRSKAEDLLVEELGDDYCDIERVMEVLSKVADPRAAQILARIVPHLDMGAMPFTTALGCIERLPENPPMAPSTDERQIADNVSASSRPSQLRITDLRLATLVGAPMRCPLLRIDTNQGIHGLGEVRDGASEEYALPLKSRLLGENPCDVDRLFRKIKQFGHHGRQGGGVSGVEMALLDLAGKAYGVPVYQLLGGKFRDRVRCYCDTDSTPDPQEMGRRLRARIELGFTFLKMDLGISLCRGTPGTVCAPAGALETHTVMHPFTGIRLTDKGIALLCDYVAAVRESIGWEVPLALDHFGHLGIESCIRLAQALDRFGLAWLEDMVPWQYTDQYVRLAEACETPICTGEDIYLKEGFLPLFERRAIGVVHPDLATAGGILETKKIGDLAQEHGIAMALHMAGSPVAAMAAVHCAAATENFLALEDHSTDVPWWDDLVTGIPKPIIQGGAIAVPEGPGLGIELDPDVVRAHLDPERPGYFEPTPEWNALRSHDRLWS